MIDLAEIGSGGGSIAWVDNYKRLHVGPQSAGSIPGPVAYNKGGHDITTTDANIYLGRINKDFFCGEKSVNIELIDKALKKLTDYLSLTQLEVA